MRTHPHLAAAARNVVVFVLCSVSNFMQAPPHMLRRHSVIAVRFAADEKEMRSTPRMTMIMWRVSVRKAEQLISTPLRLAAIRRADSIPTAFA